VSELKSIRIGPIDFAVREIERLVNTDAYEKLSGHIRYTDSEILLENNMESQAKRQILWHEILHGILTQAGYSDHDEKMIDIIAYGVMQVLRDNPALREAA
jgi:hypothetical protein